MAGIFDIVTIDTDENGVATTRRIHLNNEFGNFHIKEWNPVMPPPEDLFTSSPFSDGRVIAMRKYGNAIDELTLDVDGCTLDAELQALRAVLVKAVEYWDSEWTTEPVWIEEMGDNNSAIAYSYLYGWNTPGETNPFQPPRSGDMLLTEFSLVLEHGFWMDSLAGNCVQLSAQQNYYDVDNGNYLPTQSSDDASVDRTAGSITLNNFLYFGKDVTPHTLGSGMRFRTVSVPNGVTIIRSQVYFTAGFNLAGATCNLVIKGEAADNAATFSTYANYTGRALTAASVAWGAVPAWTAGTIYTTPDLKTIVQEIISRPGWVANNSLVLFVEDNGSSNNAYRGADDFDHLPAPILHIDWYNPATRTFGVSESCDPVFFSDRHNQAQLTHIFYYDASTGAYSPNLVGAALPFDLFPNPYAVGDILYFIIDTAVINSGPFGSLVLDILGPDAGLGGSWNYWNGGWAAMNLFINDLTGTLGIAGMNIVDWEQQADWVTTTINGITGYIINFTISAVGATSVPPKQQHQGIYAVVTPFLDIDAARVGGDVPMLAEETLFEATTGGRVLNCGRVWAGLRTLRRGPNFTAYLNFADEQNPSGVTVTAGTSFQTDVTSETGRASYWNSGSTAWEIAGYMLIDAPLAKQYVGSYMMFLRARLTAAETNYQFKIRLGFGSEIYYETIAVQPFACGAGQRISLSSFGEIKIPMDPKLLSNRIYIEVQAKTGAIANDAYLHTLILIPNDEWIGAYERGSLYSLFNKDLYLNVDPISQVKLSEVAIIRLATNGTQYFQWDDRGPDMPRLKQKYDQRLWMFHPAEATTYISAFCAHSGSFQINAIKKYFFGWL